MYRNLGYTFYTVTLLPLHKKTGAHKKTEKIKKNTSDPLEFPITNFIDNQRNQCRRNS